VFGAWFWIMACLFHCFFLFLADIRHDRRCGVCRLPDHDFRRCPIATAPDILCGCGQHTCGKCSAACPVCDKKGHAADTLRQQLRLGIVPKWACPEHKMEDMHVRMASDLDKLSATQRAQKDAARGSKRRLAALVPENESRLRTHSSQAEIVDLTGLGGAAASPPGRTSNGVAAALQDDGVSRPAARALGAFTADSAGHSSGQAAVPPPGPLAAVDVTGRRTSVVAALQEQLKKMPRYSSATRGEMRRREREVGLGAAGTAAGAEVLGSTSPFFKVKGKELKRAAVRYVGLPDTAGDSVKVNDAFAAFVGPGKMYTGASVTNKTLSCDFVCGELMACAESERLTVPAVFASMKQFIVEMRAGDEDMCGFFKDLDSKSTASNPSL